MNKADLKAKWSKYCDTDKLVDDMQKLLKNFGHRNSEHGICIVLDKYFTAKEPIIKLFATSNHYAGNMRIILKKEFDRDIDRNAIFRTCRDFPQRVGADKIILKYTDKDGKTITDYLVTGKNKICVLNAEDIKSAQDNTKNLKNFNLENGATKETADMLINFHNSTDWFADVAMTSIPENITKFGVEYKKGMKTSRAFNKMCTQFGVDKAGSYNKLFAEYADLVAGGTRSMNFIVSVNPLDYITMSIGKSWTSCHSTKARSDGYAAGACGGCVSYMLDNCSIITYVVDKLTDDLHMEGKIYRQMYHYSGDYIVQSRLYPQGNDGATDLYAKFRGFMCEEFTELLNLSKDSWTKEDAAYVRDLVRHIGYHYPDIKYNNGVSMFYPTEKEKSFKRFTIGSYSYCFYCGERLEQNGRLSHGNCTY